MNCKQFSQHIGDYVDRSLGDDLAAIAEAHINACPKCASLVKELESTSRMVRSLDYQSAPMGFESRLKSRLAAQTSPEVSLQTERSKHSWLRSIGEFLKGSPSRSHHALRPALAGFLLCAVIGGSMLFTSHDKPSVGPATDWAYLETCRNEHVSFTATNPLTDDSAALLREHAQDGGL